MRFATRQGGRQARQVEIVCVQASWRFLTECVDLDLDRYRDGIVSEEIVKQAEVRIAHGVKMIDIATLQKLGPATAAAFDNAALLSVAVAPTPRVRLTDRPIVSI
jgi:hypothetical protein